MCDLCTVTIYDHPADFPMHYVARRFHIVQGSTEPVAEDEPLAVSVDLEAVRDIMRRQGLHRIPRSAGDESQILEVWL
jgi:hypothetical protein